MSDRTVFALDIGTRSVVGLVGRFDGEQFQIEATTSLEHSTRSMLDGQIHDIDDVAKVIRDVKTSLEEQAGPLSGVAVAAAGRALRTVRASVTRETLGERLTQDEVLAMELEAVTQAEAQLSEQHSDAARYHCVGYTVLTYQLDDSRMGSLVGQAGLQAEVEIIATFLPKVVVDSLQYALERSDLQMEALTLEPIAAINALIPASMRKLNLALIDIGAGTSDIAITSDGTVTAYGMVPVAGDEITEALSSKLLLDFAVAESVKRELTQKKKISYIDVLGITHKSTPKELLEQIHSDVSHLAKHLAEEMIRLNGRAPQAVMLVGGGSQTAGLREILAAELQLPLERVVIRGVDAIARLEDPNRLLKGPEFVTPVGIALSAITNPVTSVQVQVNGKVIRLFEFRPVTVMDAVMAAKIEYRKLYGRPGAALTVTIEEEIRVIRGSLGTPPLLTKNGQACHLDERIAHLDVLEIQAGLPGQDAMANVADVMDAARLERYFYLNEEPVRIPTRILMNKEPVDPSASLVDRAAIEYSTLSTLREILAELGVNSEETSDIHVTLNSQSRVLQGERLKVTIDGSPASLDTEIREGSWVVIERVGSVSDTKLSAILGEEMLKPESIEVYVNGELKTLTAPTPKVHLNHEEITSSDVILQTGDQIRIVHASITFTVAELIHQLQFMHKRPPAATDLQIEMNGKPADLMTVLEPGASLVVEWVVRTPVV